MKYLNETILTDQSELSNDVVGTHTGPLMQHDYPEWEGGVNKMYHGIRGAENNPRYWPITAQYILLLTNQSSVFIIDQSDQSLVFIINNWPIRSELSVVTIYNRPINWQGSSPHGEGWHSLLPSSDHSWLRHQCVSKLQVDFTLQLIPKLELFLFIRKAVSCHYCSSDSYFIDVKGTTQENIAKVNLDTRWYYKLGLRCAPLR